MNNLKTTIDAVEASMRIDGKRVSPEDLENLAVHIRLIKQETDETLKGMATEVDFKGSKLRDEMIGHLREAKNRT